MEDITSLFANLDGPSRRDPKAAKATNFLLTRRSTRIKAGLQDRNPQKLEPVPGSGFLGNLTYRPAHTSIKQPTRIQKKTKKTPATASKQLPKKPQKYSNEAELKLADRTFESVSSADGTFLGKLTADLESMEEDFEDYGKDVGNSHDDAADAFCGYTLQELLTWNAEPGELKEADVAANMGIKSLLLRALFDAQRTFIVEMIILDMRKCFEAASVVRKQKERSLELFVRRAKGNFVRALWKHFVDEWLPTHQGM